MNPKFGSNMMGSGEIQQNIYGSVLRTSSTLKSASGNQNLMYPSRKKSSNATPNQPSLTNRRGRNQFNLYMEGGSAGE